MIRRVTCQAPDRHKSAPPGVNAGRVYASRQDPSAHGDLAGVLLERDETTVSADILYSDSLIEISDETIVFRHYYFPLGAKRLRLSDIERVVVRTPTFANGKYRLQGSGGRTWFPMDRQRPKRQKIFILVLRHQWHRIGFTVEDEAAVERILQARRLL